VRNDGKTRAEQVQVYVAGLSERRGKTFEPVESFFPANLTWTHGLPNAGRTVFAAGISPKMEKHCDLARVLDPTNPGVRQALRENVDGVAAAECLLTLQLEDTPATKSHLVPPGTYRLTLRVAGANSAPRDVTIELTMTGKWFADEDQMFAEGLWATVV